MLRIWTGRSATYILLAAMLTLLPPATAQAQSAAELDVLAKEIVQLHRQGKYAEAIPLMERLLMALEPDSKATSARVF